MGFGAFLILCLIVCGLAWCATALIQYFYSGCPAIVPKIIWGVAILIILYTLVTAMGLLGHDVPIPRVR